MASQIRPTIRATLTMFGTVVGAGTFVLPYVFKSTGILAGSVVYWLLALVMLATHLQYADVVLRRTTVLRRFPSHVTAILGAWPGRLAFLVHPLQLIGICFVYLLLGGSFLASFAAHLHWPSATLLWQILFWLAGAAIVRFGLKFVARVETWLTFGLIALLLLSTGIFASQADFSLLRTANWDHLIGAFGVILFALGAYPIIPEVAELCGKDPRKTRRAVVLGSMSAAFVMWMFGSFGYLALGNTLTSQPEEIARAFPSSVWWLFSTVGFLAIATSFITLMQDLISTFVIEFRLSKRLAWTLALGSLLVLLVLTERDILTSINFIGSVFHAIVGVLIAWMAIRLSERTRQASATKRLFPLICAIVFCLAFVWSILFRG